MLVGVCCECQQGGKLLRYERGRAIIDSHDAFGSFCKGSGTAPQATYDDLRIEKDPAYALEKLAGVKVCVIEGKGASVSECDGETCAECNSGPIFSLEDHAASCSKSTFKSDRLERSSEHNSRSPDIYPDDFDREEHNRIQDRIFERKHGPTATLRGVCPECKTGDRELNGSGLLALHCYPLTNKVCRGTNLVPQASYDPARLEKDPRVKVFVCEGKREVPVSVDALAKKWGAKRKRA